NAAEVLTPTAYTSTIEARLQDMGDNGITPGPIVLATPTVMNQALVSSNIMFTNIVDILSSNRWYFAVRGFENSGIDRYDNWYVTTQPGPVAMVQGLTNQTMLQGRTATLNALVDGDGPYTYRWFQNGALIAGA